jgi:curved DNA-binding protein CbpA
MNDLYQILGAGKKASRKQIREAYRAKAKAAHPDTGGSPEKFALIKRAHDVLADDDRRAKYDRTGDDSEPKPDNDLQMAVNILGMILDKVLMAVDKKGAEPVSFNIISDMKIMLGGDIDSLSECVLSAKRAAVKVEKMLGRFKVKKGHNFLEGIIKQKVETAQKNVKNMEEQLAVGKRAMDMLRDYEFKYDAAAGMEAARGASAFNMNDLMMQAMSGMRFQP